MKRRIAYGLLFVFALGVVQSLLGDPERAGSTFSPNRRGSKALLRVLQQKNIPTERFFHPFKELSQPETAKDTTLFIVEPANFGGSADLLAWIKSGNRAVVFDTGRGSLDELYKALDFKVDEDAPVTEQLFANDEEPVQLRRPAGTSYPELKDVTTLTVPGVLKVKIPKTATLLVGSEASAMGFVINLEAGQLWYFSGANLIENRQLASHDNLRLMYQLASAGSRVLFDEFHHGYTAPLKHRQHEVWQTVLLLAGCLGAWLAAGGISRSRRFGNAVVDQHELVSSTVDFTTVLGQLYAEHHAGSALKFYLFSWRRRAAMRFGVAERFSNAEFSQELKTIGIIGEQERAKLLAALDHLAAAGDGKNPENEACIVYLEELLREKSGASATAVMNDLKLVAQQSGRA